MNEHDYIVVGAGSAGCVVAARLAETGARVLLVEAGRTDRTRFCRQPGMISIVHTVPQLKKKFDWGYYSAPQPKAADRKIPQVRGKVLGGSSSINGMLFVRGNRANYDAWAAEGCDGWGWADVLRAYKKMESWEGGESEYRGGGGPVAVTKQKDLTPVSTRFVDAIAETCGVPRGDDYNGAEQTGAFTFQMSAKDGIRSSSSEAYLFQKPMPANLEVVTDVAVSKIVLEGTRAVGVEVIERGQKRTIRAAKEVIVSAGAFGSPHLLQLSGIGPAALLREHGIPVAADFPVGENLHDHPFLPITFLSPQAIHTGTALHFFGGMWTEATRGGSWFGRTVFETVAFVPTSRARDGVPDLQLHGLPWAYPTPNQDLPVRPDVDKRPCMTVFVTLIYPKSRGFVRLASADPTVAPVIDPRYLAEPDDLRFLIECSQMTRAIAASKAMDGAITGELHPGSAFLDDGALKRELPTRLHTAYHPVGTCRMGKDERAVVDPKLRVRGIEGLRVADASIMPSVVGGNTNAPCMMIGERCADFVRESA